MTWLNPSVEIMLFENCSHPVLGLEDIKAGPTVNKVGNWGHSASNRLGSNRDFACAAEASSMQPRRTNPSRLEQPRPVSH